jgi:hypothetical protein
LTHEHIIYDKFIKNKYFRWYCGIIENALGRTLTYDSMLHEKHHCLPKSLGGEQLVILTHREHYICHELLTRFTTGKDKMKMCFALHTFFHFDYHRPNIKKSILHETHRKIFREACRERTPITKSETFIFKNMDTGEQFEGTRKQFKEYSNTTAQEIYNLLKHNSKNIRWNSKRWGVYNEKLQCFSFEIDSIVTSHIKKTCENCGKLVSGGNYSRWHGVNCKTINPKLHASKTLQIRNLNKKLPTI